MKRDGAVLRMTGMARGLSWIQPRLLEKWGCGPVLNRQEQGPKGWCVDEGERMGRSGTQGKRTERDFQLTTSPHALDNENF